VRLGTLHIRRLAFVALCALAIAACGSGQKPTATNTTTAKPTHNSTTVDIYSSLPDSGAEAAHSHQIETGIRFALNQAHHTAGHFKVDYVQLACDSLVRHRSTSRAPTSRGKISSRARGNSRRCGASWNPNAVVDNAETAARNPQTVAYIGDLNSGATELSLPILNQAGIVQITPGSGYPGLTNSVTVKTPKGIVINPITQSPEPGKYYPQGLGNRTLLRMIPNDLVQASAALDVLHKAGCEKFSAWNFGTDTESKSLLAAVIATAVLKYKMDYSAPPAIPAKTSYLTYVTHLVAPTGIHCAVLVGHVTKAAESLTLHLREQLTPSPTIIGTSGFCNSEWLQGIPSVDRKLVAADLYCTTAARPVTVKEYDGSAKFIAQFRRTYHREPTAYNLYGYVATVMLMRALKDADSGTDIREQVLTNMVDDNAPNAVDYSPGQVSAFSFDKYGNLESSDYGIDSLKRGKPQYSETVDLDDSTHLLPSGG
jgi:branched-chain amino acid transport system substrate-binding protein